MQLIGTYKNGNYLVAIYDDGTKIRFNNEDHMRADRPESIDITISKKCEQGCPYCYEGCVPNGKIVDFNSPLFDSIPPYTEIALNGNGIFNNLEFDNFLFKMAAKKVICNVTVNIKDFMLHFNDFIQYHADHGTINGVGVSINEPIGEEVITYLKNTPNIVVHVIAGIVPWETLVKLSDKGIKLLILGYKEYGRGLNYLENHEVYENINILKSRLDYLYSHFKVVSFDNLAIKQLDVRSTVSEKTWETFYLGDDGSATFFIDMVNHTYAKSSISPRHSIDTDDVITLFRRVRDGEV